MSEMLDSLGQAHMLAISLADIEGGLLIGLGFSLVVFFHELGHFMVAKWADVRVERFAVGFGAELFGFTRGETRYSFNVIPLGGYVKMLGQEDFDVDEMGQLEGTKDPRSFMNKSVGQRMAIVSAGVIMNLVVAAVLFMVVYMVGKEEVSPVVGAVTAGSPAAEGGLHVGDRIVSINDSSINSFDDISMAVVLAEPYQPLEVVIEREGERITKLITPRMSEVRNLLLIGILPQLTNRIIGVANDFNTMDGPKPLHGDTIIAVNGTKLSDAKNLTFMDLLLQNRNQNSTMLVERAGESPDAPAETVEITVPKIVSFSPRGMDPNKPRDLLGLVPRMRVTDAVRDGMAQRAGLKDGDIIARVGGIDHPTSSQFLQLIGDHPDQDIPIHVIRQGEPLGHPLYIRPRKVGESGKVQPGFDVNAIEQDAVVLADVVRQIDHADTPTATSDLQAGDQIIRVDQIPIAGWADLAEQFRQSAGSTVTVTYFRGDAREQRETQISIPESISTVLDLPSFSPTEQSTQSIHFLLDGKGYITVERNGRQAEIFAFLEIAIDHYLRGKLGESVNVTYKRNDGEVVTTEFSVTSDNVDPWYRRVIYTTPAIVTEPERYLNRQTNPITAIWTGVRRTYYMVAKAYLTFQRMIFTRSVGVENISGPVGILRAGTAIAQRDKIDMLYFLAFLSANLAVINFLPLPVVDGGHMVFLLIERIKGSPVNLRIQVVTQMIGLVLILGTFIVVTVYDVVKWVG